MVPGRKILILGSPGAGKSTLARELSRRLGLPVIHLDRLHWLPGWVEKPQDLFMSDLREAISQNAWICDGNYSGSLEVRLSRADTLIWLDFPRWRCLWNIFQRLIKFRGRARPDMTPGCIEHFNWEFVIYVWRFKALKRPQLADLFSGAADRLTRIRLQNPSEIRDLLKTLPTI